MTPIYYGPGQLAWIEPETEEERKWLEERVGMTAEECLIEWVEK